MDTNSVQKAIIALKKETDTVILAHSYESHAIIEVADVVGDSYKLSVMAKNAKNANILFCGVHFMAETAKILNPDKRVFMANNTAGCKMAEQLKPKTLVALKNAEPDRQVVAYINTTASLKALSDVCVTSSSAVKIVKAMKSPKILFIPDCNLGSFVQKAVPEKDIKLFNGGCPYHSAVTVDDVTNSREKYPDAVVLVHPECVSEVAAAADFVGSTADIMDYVKCSSKKSFIIGTEISIAEHLQYDYPDKDFHILSSKILCPDMKVTTLMDVLNTLKAVKMGNASEILMTESEINNARRCIDEMLRLGQ